MARNLGKIDTNKKHSYKYSQKVWAGFLADPFWLGRLLMSATPVEAALYLQPQKEE